jgi:hypothetical protein
MSCQSMTHQWTGIYGLIIKLFMGDFRVVNMNIYSR